MGLQKTSIINGISVPNAYIRIDTVNGCKSNIMISVNTYASQVEFTAGTSYLKQQLISFTPSVSDSAVNFIKQGYTYLKTLADFKDATDVLEAGQSV